jgi:hopanoid C-3 methylase
MKFLAVHPSPLLASKLFLRLEPLGLELIAAAALQANHDVYLIDLQVESHSNYFQALQNWQPDVIGFSCNYLANVPEIIDLAKATKAQHPDCFIFVGGHSASFISDEFLTHGAGAIDCILKGEGEATIAQLLAAIANGQSITTVPGVATLDGQGPPPIFVEHLDQLLPARHLLRHRRKYFIGELDPCASIEFSRGCPWDCVFCSAWTFYGRSYRVKTPERIVAELEQIRESGVFIVDDVSFVQAKHGFEIGEAIARRGIQKKYYLETRGDVLLRNKEVFEFWKKIGLTYMFLGLEAIDEDGLKKYRKRVTLSKNFEALEYARSLDIAVAVNIIVDPDWDERRFEVVREWALEVPEIVSLSVNTPYPGTESWRTESRNFTSRDYRLFDIQHAVLPTKLPLDKFYEEYVKTQQILNNKHLGWGILKEVAGIVIQRLLQGQTNFINMLWKFNSVFDPKILLADHQQPVTYEINLPPSLTGTPVPVDRKSLYIHPPEGRRGRQIDNATETFVDETRMGTSV